MSYDPLLKFLRAEVGVELKKVEVSTLKHLKILVSIHMLVIATYNIRIDFLIIFSNKSITMSAKNTQKISFHQPLSIQKKKLFGKTRNMKARQYYVSHFLKYRKFYRKKFSFFGFSKKKNETMDDLVHLSFPNKKSDLKKVREVTFFIGSRWAHRIVIYPQNF